MKIRRLSEFQYRFSFGSIDKDFSDYQSAFLASDLGKIYQAIPWDALVECLGLKDAHKGPRSTFSPQGKLALMFLKHHAACSDRKLIDQLNANIDYQLFCDVHIPPQDRIKNYKIVSAIRCELADRLEAVGLSVVQKELVKTWLPYMDNLESITCDATCYESAIRYPTDVKLLWEAVEWSYKQMKRLSKAAKVTLLRTKYRKWAARYVSYSKMKRKRRKKTNKLKRALLLLLDKINQQLRYLQDLVDPSLLSLHYRRKRSTIERIYQQQYILFHGDKKGVKKVKDRIVSIDKPYIRPIVRGKENKLVEFGAKVHKVQIDGISLIEHLSFDAFNEGTRFIETIFTVQQLTKKRVRVIGADAIYATNKNRSFASKYSIKTDFKPKGRPPKNLAQRQQRAKLAQMITKERASRLEGSFGTDKEHFLLKKNLARTRKTEVLMIFFGIHTSNALKIGRRMAQKMKLAA